MALRNGLVYLLVLLAMFHFTSEFKSNWSWLSKNGKGLGVWPALVKPAGLDSDILGTVAAQGISRKEKEGRSFSYGIKKQNRMWRDKFYAVKHKYL